MPPSEAQYFEHNPWEFWTGAGAEAHEHQRSLQAALTQSQGMLFGQDCYIAESAVIYGDGMSLGDRSFIAADAQVMGEITIGADSSVNPYTDIRGDVSIGNGVRIGAHTSILGFNHLMEPDRPVFEQGVESRGIKIGNDVWIGSRVVIVDGVNVGDHVVIGAGSIVTRDVADWSVVAGNPARLIRDRRSPTTPGSGDLAQRAAQAAQTQSDELPSLLKRHHDDASGRFVNRAGEAPDARATCDAVELSMMLRRETPLGIPAADLVKRLASMQDADSGLVPDPDEVEMLQHAPIPNLRTAYNTLCVGNALGVLGAALPHRVNAVLDIAPAELLDALEDMPWGSRSWEVGAWIDTIGSVLAWSGPSRPSGRLQTSLLGWLHLNCDPATGLWGTQHGSDQLQAVNGFYRLTRGTFALWRMPIPYPHATIDTTLAHSRNPQYFARRRGNACNVLDVTHALWLCTMQVDYRRDEIDAWARFQLERVVAAGGPDGFSFDLERGTTPTTQVSLDGTEMWAAIMWFLSDLLGFSDRLGFVPGGIHRPDSINGPGS